MRLARRVRELTGTVTPVAEPGSGITRDVGSVAVIEHDGSNYDRKTPDGIPNYAARAPVAQRFFQTHGDFYDFVVVFTNFPFDTGDAQAFYNLVRNDVRGIGRPLGDHGALFGSPARLKGYIDMADLDRWRTAGGDYSLTAGEPGFTATLNVLAHELGHQWLADVQYLDGTGHLSSDLLGADGAHWSYLLDSDASVMYGSDWVAGDDGRYVAARVGASYSGLDLYLMGLLDPARLPPFTLLRNPAVDPKQLPAADAAVDAVPETITPAQVIAAMGPRAPDHNASPKELRLGFILLTRPGVEPDAEDLAAVERVRGYFAAHFFALTRGAAVADTLLAEVAAPPPAPTPDLDRALAWLLAQQGSDGSWREAASTAVRDTAATLETLAAIGQSGASYQAGRDWLSSTPVGSVDFISRRAAALALVDPPAAVRASLLQDVLSAQAGDGGFGFLPGFESDALDTALALRALSRLRQPAGPKVKSALSALAARQLPTGGWPMVDGGETSTVATAEVLLALQDWALLPEAQTLLARGLSALVARGNPDGGFGETVSTGYGTALVLQVLTRSAAPALLVDAAVAWLHAHQQVDGSWAGSAYETALVIGALRAGAAANLTVPADGLTVTPESPVPEGVTVQVGARVKNVGRRASPPTRALLFEGAPNLGTVLGQSAVPALEPGAQSGVEFRVTTAERPGTRTLFVVVDPDGEVAEAREDDNAASRPLEVKGLLPDLVITSGDLAVSPYPPEVGETVEVSAVVTNRGERASGPSVLRIVRGDPRAGGIVVGTSTVPGLRGGEAVRVTLPWNPGGPPGNVTLSALADSAAEVFETDEFNNEASIAVSVAESSPVGPDLEVGPLTLAPSTLQYLPSTVTLKAVVRNLGREPVTSTVAVIVAGQAAAERPVTLSARSTASFDFTLPIVASGDRLVVVRADPAGTVQEADETNNEAAVTLVDPRNTVDLEISPGDVTLPSSIVAGEPLRATAIVRNRGTAPVAGVPLVLRRKTPGDELARAVVTLAPGTASAVAFSSASSFLPGPVALSLTVDPFGLVPELSEQNNTVDVQVEVLASERANLQVDGADVRFEPDPPLEGQRAAVRTLVRNTSATPSGPFTVRFYRQEAGNDHVLVGESRAPALEAAGSTLVSLDWDPVNVRGAWGLVVVADALEEVSEYDESDNRAFRPFSVMAFPDLALTTGQVTLDPRYPRAGQAVTVRAVVRNVGQQMAPAGPVYLFAGEPAAGRELARATVPALAPAAAATIELAWTAAVEPGETTLSLLVDPERLVAEADEANNLARVPVLVQDADLFLSETHFSPDGDGVRDQTLLGYRASSPATVLVSNRAGKRIRVLAPAATSGSLPWDGRDDHGRIQPDGPYTFTLEGQGGSVLGRVQAFVDTNRESIHEAAGTTLLGSRNLTCGLPDFLEGPVFLPSEDEVLFIVNASFPNQPFPLGLVRVGLDGRFAFVSRDDWYAGETAFPSARAVSPDGRALLVRKGDALHVVDLQTGARREVAARGALTASWSPDGRWIATGSQVLSAEGTVVTELPETASSSPWAWSPDSQWLALGNVLARRDGSAVRTVPGVPGQAFQVRDTVWRSDNRIVTWVSGCGEGCGGFTAGAQAFASAVFLVDPEALAARELEWLRNELAADVTLRPLGWSADSSRLLYAFERGDKGVAASRVASEDGASAVQLLGQAVHLSPHASAAWYSGEAAAGSSCLGTSDQFVALNLQNLAVTLRPSRLPANNGILVSATVADRHLAYHQLEWALASEPLGWHPIGAASDVPVLDDVLTVWIPPAPGTYLLRLRAEDKAGNVRSRVSVVSWDHVAALANVVQSEFVVSPDGDGTKDVVTFGYLVLEPTRVEVRVVGPHAQAPTGPVVRQLRLDHPDIGPAAFSWDGRDAQGAVVPDGRYTVFINDLPFRVTIDATPPDIAWAYHDLRVQDGRLVADRVVRIVDAGLKEWGLPGWFDGREPVYEPLRDEDGEIVYADGVPRMLVVGTSVAGRREVVPAGVAVAARNEVYGLATDPAALLTAEDFAGNRSTLFVVPVEERLVMLKAAGHHGPFEAARVYRLPPVTVFRLAETIRETPPGGDAARLRFQPREGGPWTEGPAFPLDGEADWTADFATLGLALGREYRGQFVTSARGRVFASEQFLFRPCTESLSLAVELMPEGVSPNTALWQVAVAADAPEPLVGATLTITGVGKLAGYRLVRTLDVHGDNYILTPLPSCTHDPPSLLQFEAQVTGQSGRVYTHDGQCLVLRRLPHVCSSLRLTQSFGYCSGTPDVLAIRAEATSAAPDATARLYRGSADAPDPIDEFPVGFTLGPPTVKSVLASVTGVPEGGLPITGVLGGPENPDTVTTVLQAVIDRTPGAVDFLAPSEGGQLCVRPDPVTGREHASLAIQVDDAGAQAEFASAFLEHLEGPRRGERVASSLACAPVVPGAPTSHPPHCGNEGATFPRVRTGAPAHLGWDVTGLEDGAYGLQATFCDRAGNRAMGQRRVSLRREPPRLRVLEVAPPVFSPNGDGAADAVAVKVRLTEAVRLRVEVPGVVRLLDETTVSAGDHLYRWDGRTPQGAVVADGTYTLVFVATDACGRTATLRVAATVDTTPPAAVLHHPLPGQALGVAVDVRGIADDESFAAYELAFGPGLAPTEWTVVGSRQGTSGAVPAAAPPASLGRWDTPDQAGTYTLRLVVSDAAQNRAQTRVAVEVGARLRLGRFTARPDLFSPNGDGRRESASIEYELLDAARVTLEIVQAATPSVVRTLEADVERGAGIHVLAWDGTANGAPAADGEYRLRLRLESLEGGGAGAEEQSVAISLDRQPPAITVDRPAAGGFVARDERVRGAVEDARLAQYVVAAFPATNEEPIELQRGARSRDDRDLGPLTLLADGSYTLVVRGEDAAENRATATVPFVLDGAPPAASIGQPAAHSVLDATGPDVVVTGTATDAHLLGYTLAFGPGAEPAYTTPVASGSVATVGATLGSWHVRGLPDGTYSLHLEAVDRAGLRSEDRRIVVLDGTVPRAQLLTPVEGAVTREGGITGTVSDANLDSWTLEMAPGPAVTAALWSPVSAGTSEVRDGALAEWSPLPADGTYTLRLTVKDKAGHTAVALRGLAIDQTAPAAPTGLTAAVDREAAGQAVVRLSWNAGTENDLAAYRVVREDTVLGSVPSPATAYVDGGRPEGKQRYRVSALDRAGNVSPPAELTVEVDLTPPLVDLLRPAAGSIVSGLVTIRGTAYSPEDFREYRLFVGASVDASSLVLVRRSTVPVAAASLGEWTAAGTGPRAVVLEAEDLAGNQARVSVTFVVDGDPPEPPVLLSAAREGEAGRVGLAWAASGSADVSGYVVYRNRRVANAAGLLLDDLRPLLVPGSSYVDVDLPDGLHCYRVVAMDAADNLSVPSNELCVALDERPPSVRIVQPAPGTRFDHPLHLVGQGVDLDVAWVQFQYRAEDGSAWRDLSRDVAAPYEATLDPVLLAPGTYLLRALASDHGGRTDPDPQTIHVTHGDATAPAAPTGLAAQVDGGHVSLEWRAAPEVDVAGYHLFREGTRITPDALSAPAFDDQGRAAGSYRYEVTAVDGDGNESAPSQTVHARVFAIELESPAFPVVPSTPAEVAVIGAPLGSEVEILRGEEVVGRGTAMAPAFVISPVHLAVGPNLLHGRARLPNGDRSLASDEVVLISNAPPDAVTGLSATVDGLHVHLVWEPAHDPETHGYVVERDGARLTPSTLQRTASSVVATHEWFDPSVGSARRAPDAFDGDRGTAWIAPPDRSEAAWTLIFPGPILVEEVRLDFATVQSGLVVEQPVRSYRVEARWEGRFVPVAGSTGNTSSRVRHVLPTPFATDALRVVIHSSEPLPGIAELEVVKVEVVPVGTTAFDDHVSDGRMGYRVAAVDRYGAQGPPARLELAVGDVSAPSPPTGVGARVDGRDVTVTWQASPEPDLHHYVVIRDGLPVASVAETMHRDLSRANGTYAYRVVAADGAGNQSPPSETATAIVNVAPLSPPALQGVVGARGQALLSWEHPGAADYHVSRAAAAGGSYVRVARVGQARQYVDLAAPLGTTQHYVVHALDEAGNVSAPSNEIALALLRTLPVAPPEIVFPTKAGEPIAIDVARPPVQGRAPPASVVELHLDGAVAGVAESYPAWAERGVFAVPDGSRFAISRDGRSVVYVVENEGVEQLRAHDLPTGLTRVVAAPSPGRILPPVLSDDGRRVALVVAAEEPPFARQLYTVDLTDGAATAVDTAADRPELGRWSPDGTRLAYVVVSPSWPFPASLVIRDVLAATERVLAVGPEPDLRAPAWSPDGTRLAFAGAGGQIVVVDVESGEQAVVGDGTDPAWSPEGTRLVYASAAGASNHVRLLDFDTGATRSIAEVHGALSAPAFDRTGLLLAYLASEGQDDEEAQVVVHDLATGRRVPVEARPGLSPRLAVSATWLSDGGLALGYGDLPRLTFFEAEQGFFAFADVPLHVGPNVLTARAVDLASGLASLTSAPVEVTVGAERFPDLAVAAGDLAVHPAAPLKGAEVILSARVRGVGSAAAEDVGVEFAVFDAAGQTVLLQEVHLSRVEPGAASTVSARWTPTVVGRHGLRVRVDPRRSIVEVEEDNNEAAVDVEVSAGTGWSARIESDRETYAARSPVLLEAVVVNAEAAATVSVRTTVEDTAGRTVAVVDERPMALSYGGRQPFSVSWNTGATYAGEYAFRLEVADGSGAEVAAASRRFRIAPHVALEARLRPARTHVPEEAAAAFAASVDNVGVNAPLVDVHVWFRVFAEASTAPVYEQERVIALLLPGAGWQGDFIWPATHSAGAYRGVLTALAGGEVRATSESPFVVTEGSPRVAGALALDATDVLQGEGVGAQVTVHNPAAEPVFGLPVAVEVRTGAEATLLRRESLVLDVAAAGLQSTVVALNDLPIGRHLVLLRIGTADIVSSRASLHVHGAIVPPTVEAPADGTRVSTPRPELRANNGPNPDGAALSYEFELFADAALTVPVARVSGVPEGQGTTAWRVAGALAEDGTYFWRVRASDGFSSSGWTTIASFTVDVRNEPPAPPALDRPYPNERVASREPLLVVANARDLELDRLTYEFRVATDPEMAVLVASAAEVLQGAAFTAWRVPAPLDENATYFWSARAFDGSGRSDWSAAQSFTVDTFDEAPTAPGTLRPIAGERVYTQTPDLVVANAADPEGRPLAYRFEIDREPTFNSPALERSALVPGTDSWTAWRPSPLTDETVYHWRAAAHDGQTLGPWATAWFVVNRADDPPGPPVPIDPSDGQVVTTRTPALRVRNALDPDRDALTYEFEVSDASGTVVAGARGVAEAHTETSWTVPAPLAEGGPFTWRTRAHDGTSFGAWTAPWAFRVHTMPAPPSAPALVAPAEGAVLTDPAVSLVVSNASSPPGFTLTYAFELYGVAEEGGTALLHAVTDVAEGPDRTQWAVPSHLPDGSYRWRARAHDGTQPGAWMASAQFAIALDAPPRPPTGLRAAPGDREVVLGWEPNPEPDVSGYRVYRGLAAGGPYSALASVAAPGLVDRDLVNGVSVYYVVTAVDSRAESAHSAEVAATPAAPTAAVEVHVRPDRVAGECLLESWDDEDDGHDRHGRRRHAAGWGETRRQAAHRGGDGDHDDDDHDDDDHDQDDDDDSLGCPRWVYAAIEPPRGVSPSAVDRATVRLAGAVAPDPGYDRVVDEDGDGRRERKLRFAFWRVVPHLRVGANILTVSGRLAGAPFLGITSLEVAPLRVELLVTPRTLARSTPVPAVQAKITFREGVRAASVDVTGVRLNDAVRVLRVESKQGRTLIVKFNRAEVNALLGPGDRVPVWVAGTIAGVPFVARDEIRVLK